MYNSRIDRRPGTALLILTLLLSALLVTPLASINAPGLDNLNAIVTLKTQSGTSKYNVPGGLRGIDVSKWQGAINWSQVAQDDVEFAFIRASYGDTADPYFLTNAKGAYNAGIRVGAYHFARFTDRKTMQAEAKFFISQLNQVKLNYPVVLDIESRNAMTKATRTTLAQEFVTLLNNAGYKNVLIYSYSNFLDQYIDSKPFKGNLWVANYLEPPSHSFKVWQFSNSGSVKGIAGKVDINIAAQDLTTGSVRIPQASTDSAKTFLNQYYNAGINLDDKLDLKYINNVIARAFQTEVNKQLNGNVAVNGSPGATEAQLLSSISFTSETSGRITTLVQCKLMYSGCYLQPVSGRFDDNTVAAIKKYQQALGITVTGKLDLQTWQCLLKN